ncbi:Ig-like domain-containing protein [Pantoea trifolii]|uniref:Ig-like domain-containing protein n=1 Tax=Candidatus Pantoea symbiotica TaxID=1884370 RepID=UPI002413A2A2|nr:Ig-like domain-containing protein [Pantoea rodasii]
MKNDVARGPSRRTSPWVSRLVLAQIAVQTGMALTPFYAASVQAAVNASSDERMLSTAAQYASGLAQNQQNGDMSGYFSQQATGAASAGLQSWLQNFGTARVELGSDNRFKPHSGAVDLLVPLYKSDDRLLFTQNGLRNVDGQFTGNVGFGQRHFAGDWMLGYNAFYDQNFSRDHKRVGTGIEVWRDYVKLSGNGYYRLSGWKNSVDVEDYDARPANGFDLRSEAWLPAYPALGGRLMYEKYYGNEVALFGKDKRQKNPDAVSAGLSYTPVPLLSLTADHKKGGSQHETTFGLQLTYQLGQSLASHFDPGAVGQKRTLAGSGMDLVERNNNIVLEYRKQQLIDLVLPKEITGESGKTVPVNYQLTSKYGLAKIVWNESAVVAAGGKMQDLGGGRYQLTLPKYVAGTANVHALSGVAYDTRNNPSKVASTLVTVTRPAVSAEKSSVTATPQTILADGAATSVISITLNDETGAPVTGLAADLSAAVKEEPAHVPMAKSQSAPAPARPAALSTVTEQGNGVYTLTLTAGTRPMLAVVSPTLATLSLAQVSVMQVVDAASATVRDGDLTLVTDGVVANGSATNQVRARVTDATGNPVANVAVTFTLSGSARVGTGSSLTAVSGADGYVSLLYTDTVAEAVTVTATTASGSSASAASSFIADASTAALSESNLTVDRVSALANGADSVTYTALVLDTSANPVPNVTVSWAASGGNLGGATSTTGADGKAMMTLSNTVAQIVQSTASLAGSAAVNAPLVSFGADAASGGIESGDLTVDKDTAVADGSEQVTYQVLVKDAFGNPLENQTVHWETTRGALSDATSSTNANGMTQVTLTSVQAGMAIVTAALALKPAVNAPQVTFTADGSSAQIGGGDLTVDKGSIIANGADAATFTAVVKDANGNPVANHPVSWTTDRGSLSNATSQTNENGEATVRLTGTLVGTAQVAASVNGHATVNAPQVTMTADAGSAQIGAGDLRADKSTEVADGTQAITYTATVKDANGNLIPNLVVSWGTDLGNLNGTTSTTDANGEATVALRSTLAGDAIVTAQPGTGATASASAVSFTADGRSAQIGAGDLRVDVTTVVANNVDKATYTATVKDAHGNLVANHPVSWSTDKGNLSGTSSSTDTNGVATVTLSDTRVGIATVTATVNTAGTNADAVTFIADVTTAKVDAVVSDKAKITGTGVETATLTATVTDINGNPVSNFTPVWATTLGTLADNGGSDVSGKATATLTAPIHAATTNGTATVNVGGKTVAVVIRAVQQVGAAYYWTMYSDHPRASEADANNFCAIYGGGRASTQTDLQSFATGRGDFVRMSVSGEFKNTWYSLAGSWGAMAGKFHSYNSPGQSIPVGATSSGLGEDYVCVR